LRQTLKAARAKKLLMARLRRGLTALNTADLTVKGAPRRCVSNAAELAVRR